MIRRTWWAVVGGATMALPVLGLLASAAAPASSSSLMSANATTPTTQRAAITLAASDVPAMMAITSAVAQMPTPLVVTSTVVEKPAAQAAPPSATPSKAAKPAAKAAAKKPAAKVAEAKAKRPAKKVAEAKKPAPPKKIAATKPAPPSYTVTTTRGSVTTVATRIVPLPTAPRAAAHADTLVTSRTAPPAEAKAAAIPVSLTHAAAATPEKAKPAETAPVAVAIATPARQPAPATTPASPIQTAAARPAPPPPAAPVMKASPESAAAFVGNFLQSAFHIARLAGVGSLQRRAQLADLFAGKMDVPRIAGYTTGDELNGATPDVQQRFRTILVSYLVETYYPRLELASDPTVRVETVPGDRLPDGTTVVWTTFSKDGWGSQTVKWHLQPSADGYKIVDIISAGASLVQMERDTFLSVMRDGGLNQLMAKLDERTKQLASAATE